MMRFATSIVALVLLGGLVSLTPEGRSSAHPPTVTLLATGPPAVNAVPALPAGEDAAVTRAATDFLAAWERRDLNRMYGMLDSRARAEFSYREFAACYEIQVPLVATLGSPQGELARRWVPAPIASRVMMAGDGGSVAGSRLAVVYWVGEWTIGSILGPDGCQLLWGTAGSEQQRNDLLVWLLYTPYKHRLANADFVYAVVQAARTPSAPKGVRGRDWLAYLNWLSPDTPVGVRGQFLGLALANVPPVAGGSRGVVNFHDPLFLTLEQGAWRVANAVVPVRVERIFRDLYPFSVYDFPPGSWPFQSESRTPGAPVGKVLEDAD